MTRFTCIAKENAQIDARACVERQIGERCHCSKAPFAINEYAPTIDKTSLRAREELDTIRARACSYYKKPAAEQLAGPALEAHQAANPIPATVDDATTKGTVPVAEPVAAVPEVPSGTVDKVCKVFACGAPLRSDNRSGLCSPHTLVARTKAGAARLGVPRLAYPSERPRVGQCRVEFIADRKEEGTVVPIKEAVRPAAEEKRPVDAEGIPLPDVAALPHAYLVECVKEARRRTEEMDVLFVFTVAKVGTGA